MLSIHTVPFVLKKIFSRFVWNIPTKEKILYLTFDDGPIPNVTQYVLDVLDLYQAKATFFCVGDNVSKYPDILLKIAENNHTIANHTYHHLDGWKTNHKNYLNNIEKSHKIIQSLIPNYTNFLFRPPYGKINIFAIRTLFRKYKIIMWDVLSGDYDKKLNPETLLQICIKYTKPGTIIVFHDSIKAESNLTYILPKYIKYFSDKGYRFEALNYDLIA